MREREAQHVALPEVTQPTTTFTLDGFLLLLQLRKTSISQLITGDGSSSTKELKGFDYFVLKF